MLLVVGVVGAANSPAHAAGIDWAKARLFTVVAVEYRFEPNHLVFRRGVPYRLHVANRGRELHELTAPEFFATTELRDPTALNQEHTELVLQPGEQKDVYLVAKRSGRYDMRCADHDWAGMTGDIIVK
jgi:uncharacterized cupredoxin-like copper-binding protein